MSTLTFTPSEALATEAPAQPAASLPSEKQIQFARDLYVTVRGLLNELHDLDPEGWSAEGAEAMLELKGKAGKAATLDRQNMSRYITGMIELRDELRGHARTLRQKARTVETPEVPAGRYALDGEDGTTKFFVVDRPEEGRWAGYTFVSRQASDEKYAVRNRTEREAILDRIAVDPAAASLRYGKELGSCGVCGRTLTDETSRERGIGPVCAERTGW